MIYISLDDIGRHPGDPRQPCVVWVPAEAVGCHLVTVPEVPRRKWRAMVPWMLEERLLDSPDRLEFVFGDRDDQGRVPVLAVSRETLGDWRRRGLEAGCEVVQLVPDFFALPWREGEVTVAPLGERALLRFGAREGTAGPPELIWSLARNLLAEGGERRLRLLGERGDLPADLPEPAAVEPAGELFAAPSPPWLGFTPHRQRASRRQGWSPPARAAAVLAGLLVVLIGAVHLVETRRMEAQAAHLEEALRGGFQRYFGADYDFPLEDFQQVASRRLDGGGAPPGSALLAARLTRLEQVLSACGDCRVIRLEGEPDGLVATLAAASETALRRAAGSEGLPVELARAAEENWSVRIGGEMDDVR